MTSLGAAELDERYLSARPIDNDISTSAADRKFLTEAALAIIDQTRAADAASQFAASKDFVSSADQSRATLDEIHMDLKLLANTKGVALPLYDGVAPSEDVRKMLTLRDAPLEREYEQYAERESLRMLERFYDASRKANDRQVRAFALRYLRPIYNNYQTAKWLDISSDTAIARAASPSSPSPSEPVTVPHSAPTAPLATAATK